jgi:hypothetical protein
MSQFQSQSASLAQFGQSVTSSNTSSGLTASGG